MVGVPHIVGGTPPPPVAVPVAGLAGVSEQITKSFADLAGVTRISEQIRKAMENPGGARNELDHVQRRPESDVSKPTDGATENLSANDPTVSSAAYDGDDGEPTATD